MSQAGPKVVMVEQGQIPVDYFAHMPEKSGFCVKTAKIGPDTFSPLLAFSSHLILAFNLYPSRYTSNSASRYIITFTPQSLPIFAPHMVKPLHHFTLMLSDLLKFYYFSVSYASQRSGLDGMLLVYLDFLR